MERKYTKVNSHNYDRSIEETRFSLYIFYSYTLVIGHGINVMNLAPTSAFFKSNLRFRDIQIKLVKRGKNVGNATGKSDFQIHALHDVVLESYTSPTWKDKRRQRHKKIIRSNAAVLEKQLNSRWRTSSSIINHRREQTAIWYSFFFFLEFRREELLVFQNFPMLALPCLLYTESRICWEHRETVSLKFPDNARETSPRTANSERRVLLKGFTDFTLLTATDETWSAANSGIPTNKRLIYSTLQVVVRPEQETASAFSIGIQLSLRFLSKWWHASAKSGVQKRIKAIGQLIASNRGDSKIEFSS